MKEKSVLILFTLLSTALLIYLSVPNFMEKEKITDLIEKIHFLPENNVEKPNNEEINDTDFEEENNSDNKNDEEEKPMDNSKEETEQDISSEEEPSKSDEEKESPNNGNEQGEQLPSKTTFHAYFNANGAEGKVPSTVSCETTGNSCTITLPKMETNREFLGWSLNKDSTAAALTAGLSVTLSVDRTYYAITRKNYTVTVVGNGSFVGSEKKVCSIYNTNATCQITLPDLKKDFYTSWGYNSDPNNDSIEYGVNATLNVNSDQTLYAIRKIDTSIYNKYSSVALDVFNRINTLRTSRGLSTLSYSKSLELSAMLRISEIAQNYNYTVNGDRHIRISNNEPFYTVNELAYGENYFRGYGCDAAYFHDSFVASPSHLENMLRTDINIAGISVGVKEGQCYIVELFGIQ